MKTKNNTEVVKMTDEEIRREGQVTKKLSCKYDKTKKKLLHFIIYQKTNFKHYI